MVQKNNKNEYNLFEDRSEILILNLNKKIS